MGGNNYCNHRFNCHMYYSLIRDAPSTRKKVVLNNISCSVKQLIQVFALHIYEENNSFRQGFSRTISELIPILPASRAGGRFSYASGCRGKRTCALTSRFTVKGAIGKTIMIHGGTDNFTFRLAGCVGGKIARDVIR